MAKRTKRITPTNNPNILQEWKDLYAELISVQPKSKTLQIIGQRYGVTATTVRYHLFPEYKEKQKKYFSKTWSYEKQDPVIRKKRIDYKAKYMAARRHMDDLIRESYQRAAPLEAMNLEDLAYTIHDISGILFQPSTIFSLSKRFEATKGYSFLTQISGYQVPHYKLSKRPNNKNILPDLVRSVPEYRNL